MKHLKILFVSALMAFNSTVFANPSDHFVTDKEFLSHEIEKLLDRSNLIVEEGFKASIIFILSEDRRIQIHSIKSKNEEVNEFLRDRLQNKKLFDKDWDTGKYYELPVKVQTKK